MKKSGIKELSSVGSSAAPTKGVKPNMTGVPGEFVTLNALPFEAWQRSSKVSPYDTLLDDLRKRTEEAKANGDASLPGLRFADPRAKASLYARGKRKGLQVGFAIFDGALYVRIDGVTRAVEDIKEKRRAQIRKLLEKGVTFNTGQICTKLREGGDSTLDFGTLDLILTQMVRAREVVKQEGGTWKLLQASPKAAA